MDFDNQSVVLPSPRRLAGAKVQITALRLENGGARSEDEIPCTYASCFVSGVPLPMPYIFGPLFPRHVTPIPLS